MWLIGSPSLLVIVSVTGTYASARAAPSVSESEAVTSMDCPNAVAGMKSDRRRASDLCLAASHRRARPSHAGTPPPASRRFQMWMAAATLQAWAMQPRGACGGSPSKISLIVAEAGLFHRVQEALQQLHGPAAGTGGVVHGHHGVDVWAEEPRPHGALVIGGVAFIRPAGVAAAVGGVVGREGPEAARREQPRLDHPQDGGGVLARQERGAAGRRPGSGSAGSTHRAGHPGRRSRRGTPSGGSRRRRQRSGGPGRSRRRRRAGRP